MLRPNTAAMAAHYQERFQKAWITSLIGYHQQRQQVHTRWSPTFWSHYLVYTRGLRKAVYILTVIVQMNATGCGQPKNKLLKTKISTPFMLFWHLGTGNFWETSSQSLCGHWLQKYLHYCGHGIKLPHVWKARAGGETTNELDDRG